MKSINIHVPEDLHRRFKEKCKSDDVKMNQVMPAIIEHYVSGGFRAKNTVTIEKNDNN